MKDMKEINLIWQTLQGDQTDFEYEYTTKILFEKFTQSKHFDYGSYSTVLNNSVIIYSNNNNCVDDNFLNYLKKFEEQKFDFYLLHFSNENLNHDTSYYSKAKHVFRNYFDKNILEKNVTFIPLGIKSGFLNHHKSVETVGKKFDFSFIGQPKSDRYELLSVLEKLEKNFIHKTNNWNCSTSLSQEECKSIYRETKFVPCPMGWVHPDSFRIMESLESGSIPVIKKYDGLNFTEFTFGKNPLPVIDDWNSLNDLLKLDYESLYTLVHSWYQNFIESLKDKIYKTITI